jgi:hypothetical protein
MRKWKVHNYYDFTIFFGFPNTKAASQVSILMQKLSSIDSITKSFNYKIYKFGLTVIKKTNEE